MLFDAPEAEISALVLDAQGNLYASTAEAKEEAPAPAGERRRRRAAGPRAARRACRSRPSRRRSRRRRSCRTRTRGGRRRSLRRRRRRERRRNSRRAGRAPRRGKWRGRFPRPSRHGNWHRGLPAAAIEGNAGHGAAVAHGHLLEGRSSSSPRTSPESLLAGALLADPADAGTGAGPVPAPSPRSRHSRRTCRVRRGRSRRASRRPRGRRRAPGRQPPVEPQPAEPRPEGNAVYKIDPEGFVTEVFREPVLVLAMVEDHGTLLIATGNEGQIYQVNPAAGRDGRAGQGRAEGRAVVCCRPRTGGSTWVWPTWAASPP